MDAFLQDLVSLEHRHLFDYLMIPGRLRSIKQWSGVSICYTKEYKTKLCSVSLNLEFFGVGSLLQADSPLSATVLLAACVAILFCSLAYSRNFVMIFVCSLFFTTLCYRTIGGMHGKIVL
jgi:hypothetical protein